MERQRARDATAGCSTLLAYFLTLLADKILRRLLLPLDMLLMRYTFHFRSDDPTFENNAH